MHEESCRQPLPDRPNRPSLRSAIRAGVEHAIRQNIQENAISIKVADGAPVNASTRCRSASPSLRLTDIIMEGIIKTAIANGIDLERPGVEVSVPSSGDESPLRYQTPPTTTSATHTQQNSPSSEGSITPTATPIQAPTLERPFSLYANIIQPNGAMRTCLRPPLARQALEEEETQIRELQTRLGFVYNPNWPEPSQHQAMLRAGQVDLGARALEVHEFKAIVSSSEAMLDHLMTTPPMSLQISAPTTESKACFTLHSLETWDSQERYSSETSPPTKQVRLPPLFLLSDYQDWNTPAARVYGTVNIEFDFRAVVGYTGRVDVEKRLEAAIIEAWRAFGNGVADWGIVRKQG